jgi:hypothetical protein
MMLWLDFLVSTSISAPVASVLSPVRAVKQASPD